MQATHKSFVKYMQCSAVIISTLFQLSHTADEEESLHLWLKVGKASATEET